MKKPLLTIFSWVATASAVALALQSSGAVFTERNDLFITPPASATFGESSGGISSCYIPFGTYTNGSGGIEYTRITSNLIGVVASIIDAYYERRDVGEGRTHPDLKDEYAYYPTMTNTTRVLDWLNGFGFKPHSSHSWDGETSSVEDALASSEQRKTGVPGDYSYFGFRNGLAKTFSGRRLETACGFNASSPVFPIGKSWSTNFLETANDVNSWRSAIFPCYGNLADDPHMFKPVVNDEGMEEAHGLFDHVYTWLMNATFKMGTDWFDAALALAYSLDESYRDSPDLPTVLSYDTGWSHRSVGDPDDTPDDFNHWGSNTSRLDWKRLGMLCQLLRQMEVTYCAAEGEEELPLIEISVSRSWFSSGYVSGVTITVSNETGEVGSSRTFPAFVNPESWRAVTWGVVSNSTSVTSNDLGMSSLRVSASSPVCSALYRPNELSGPLYIQEDEIEAAIISDFRGDPSTSPTGRCEFSATVRASNQSLVFHSVERSLSQIVQEGEEAQSKTTEGDGAVYFSFGVPGYCYTLPDEYTLEFRKYASKSATAVFTHLDNVPETLPKMRPTWTEYREPSLKKLWNDGWIKEMKFYYLTGMMYSTNRVAGGASEWDWSSTPGDGRFLRMENVYSANSRDNALSARLEAALTVNRELMTKFREVSGTSIDYFTRPFSGMTTEESNGIEATGEFGVRYTITPLAEEFRITGRLKKNGDGIVTEVEDISVEGGTRTSDGWKLADWRVQVDGTNVTFTSGHDARVDAHMSRMDRVLWKFKNLRDPEL